MYKTEDNIYAKDTGIYGMSLYAKRDFKKGDLIFIPYGPVVKYATLYTILVDYNKNANEFLFIDPQIPEGNLSQFICHSCEPNMGIKDRTLFVAMRDIAKDEEVTIDYAMIVPTFIHPTQGEVSWKDRKCLCGRKSCRGKVLSYSELPEEEKERYKGYVNESILDLDK
ncbi:MAG: SET domain-containing protein-lysine N-methyltransferase [Candidatus Nomurabacteria bacterium]|nr:SET domain-containing protein-lysine N-methyltransferase [Candidatus Nomurabacteria bacterium]USN87680.1 MAG: SET domain-containing protein-lysine N-methyltransferase [Candidatus Nomurabacteria bacterium]